MKQIARLAGWILRPFIWLFKTLIVDLYLYVVLIIFFIIVACLPFQFYWNFIPGFIFLYLAFKLHDRLADWAELYAPKKTENKTDRT